jgi:hypothetical protein
MIQFHRGTYNDDALGVFAYTAGIQVKSNNGWNRKYQPTEKSEEYQKH